ncbi:dnaJ homolog subfamily C member 28-like [Limulus polyphemus]|uniref:DnaJ homolog subfamily C member 28-like n=1 Tax=Limulus polyphemus TaxID=6850 RepID=A0ABM1BP08_LIMPO|nr:dnaJ homolog subfamily C member 28-like [Limulus polyphemus]
MSKISVPAALLVPRYNKLCNYQIHIQIPNEIYRGNRKKYFYTKSYHGNKTSKNIHEIKECQKLLGVTDNCTEEELKNAFLSLAKQYHPDSRNQTADSQKFAHVQSAYRKLQEYMGNLSEDNTSEVLEKNFGIKHTVPQHRQYLNYEGVGYGTLSQREQQYQKYKMTRAVDQVHEYRYQKLASKYENSLMLKDAALTRQFKTSQAMERVVEDLIQKSMSKGEFNNLPGSGKPFKYVPENPYVDRMTHKLNQILINNGFTPEWIVLEKEVREDREKLFQQMAVQRASLGPLPLSEEEENHWQMILDNLKQKEKDLNVKIDKFNIIVPALKKQQLRVRLSKMAQEVLENGKTKEDKQTKTQISTTKTGGGFPDNGEGLIGFLCNIFQTK